MTPAERKFSDVEAGLMRARCLVRVLRELTETDRNGGTGDDTLSNGIYLVLAEAETALDAAAATWTEAHALAVAPD